MAPLGVGKVRSNTAGPNGPYRYSCHGNETNLRAAAPQGPRELLIFLSPGTHAARLHASMPPCGAKQPPLPPFVPTGLKQIPLPPPPRPLPQASWLGGLMSDGAASSSAPSPANRDRYPPRGDGGGGGQPSECDPLLLNGGAGGGGGGAVGGAGGSGNSAVRTLAGGGRMDSKMIKASDLRGLVGAGRAWGLEGVRGLGRTELAGL